MLSNHRGATSAIDFLRSDYMKHLLNTIYSCERQS
jgi:hypothetical protein